MRRREFIAGLGSAGAAWPLAVRAQQDKLWRIGILETQPAGLNAANLNAFRDGLRALGYVEGKNVILEYRSVDGRGERFPNLAAELMALHVDVIVTRGTPAALAAKNATSTVPIVMAAVGEPLMVVSSLARPGGNITGLSGYTTDLEAKRIEVLHELVPGATRIAGLYNMGNPIAPPQWEALQKAARDLGLHPYPLDVRDASDIAPAFARAKSEQIEAIAVGVDALSQANRKMIADLSAQNRLPAIYVSKEFVEAGGLISYGPSYPDLYRRAASYVHKVLNGEKAAELPIEQPVKFELVINIKMARLLDLDVPQMLLVRADEVIE